MIMVDKKEKLAQLKKLQKELDEGETFEGKKCMYRPLRGPSVECLDPVVTPFGFCKKHKTTVQAKKAKDKWEMEEILPAKEEVKPQQPNVIPTMPILPLKKPPPVEIPPKEESDYEDENEMNNQIIKDVKETQEKPALPPVGRLVLRPNKYNRFEDPDSHIVFDPRTKCAYGIQTKNGKVLALSNKEIDICKKRGWRYQIRKPIIPDDDEESEEEQSEEEEEEDYASDEE
jgi:hypothetical protein